MTAADLTVEQRKFWDEYCDLVRKYRMALTYDSGVAAAAEVRDLSADEVERVVSGGGEVYLV